MAPIQLTWLVSTLLTLVSAGKGDKCRREFGEGDQCLRSADNTTICWYSPNGNSEWYGCSPTSETGETDAGAMMWCNGIIASDGHDVECYAEDGCPCHGQDDPTVVILVIFVGGPVLAIAFGLIYCLLYHFDRALSKWINYWHLERREHQHVSEPDIGAAAPSSSTQRHAEVDGVPALEPQVTGDSDSSPPAFQAQTVITGVPVSGTPMCTMVTVAGRVAPRLTLAQAGSPLTLADKVEALNTELGLTFTAVSKQAVEAIAAILGMAEAIKGKPLIEQVNTCYAAAFSTARDITAHAGPTVSDPSTVGSSDPRP